MSNQDTRKRKKLRALITRLSIAADDLEEMGFENMSEHLDFLIVDLQFEHEALKEKLEAECTFKDKSWIGKTLK
jgi:hypothetical protein